jgi:hypothetical protein
LTARERPGVTTYLNIIDKSRPLIIWAIELYRDYLLECLAKGITEEHIYEGGVLHEERKQEAVAIGDEANGWIEKYIKGESAEMPKRREAQVAVNAFLDWEAANKVKFLSSERVVYSKKHDYIGKMDIEAKVNGKLSMIDIKTSDGLYNTYGMQTAAYLKADEEESGREYRGRWLIRLAKETEQDYVKRMELKNVNRQRKRKEPIEIPPYQVFEAKFFDDEEGSFDRDFKAFLNAKALYEWNCETHHWLNKAA